MASFDAESARFFPDGRVAITAGTSVYVANGDGSGRHKIADAPGHCQDPSVSPDGKRVRFTVVGDTLLYSIWEVNSDGTGIHQLSMKGLPDTIGAVGGGWTRDGRYYLFQTEHEGNWDLWALPESTGLFHRSPGPFQLTNGPLSYEGPIVSPLGRQVFAVGSKKRGELIRYDAKSRGFVPYLDGISAVESRASADGKWVVYVSYPDRSLWRSRPDGSERMQLTFPPLMVFYPKISPDGTKVAFTGMTANSGAGGYVLDMGAGTLEKVSDAAHAPDWSPDGNSLIFAAIIPGRHLFEQQHWCEIRILDLRTKKISVLPTNGDWFGPWWPQPDKLILTSSASDDKAPYLFDFKTQKWSTIDQGYNVANWVPSGDGKYLYMLTTDSQSAKIRRIRGSDFKVEVFADLAGIRLVVDDSLGQASSGGVIGIAADGSPTLTRDVGSDEIYALDVKWP